jgi:hypothetical protein
MDDAAGDFPLAELGVRDQEEQDRFDRMVDHLGEEAEELGYRTIIVEEWHECEFGFDHFVLNRDRRNTYAVTIRNYVIGGDGAPVSDSRLVVGPGEKKELGCSQTERGGPITWRRVISGQQL